MTRSVLARLSAVPLGLALLAMPAFAAAPKTYQVTGPVLDVNDSTITVQKGKEKWEIARDKDTKVTGDLKTGSKVTIEYRMTAAAVEVKGEKGAAKGEKTEKTEKTEKK
jgi:hypothetical protein